MEITAPALGTVADEVTVQPLLGDALELAEQVQFRVLSRIAPLRHQQVGREFVENLGGPNVAGVSKCQIDGCADDSRVLSLRCAHKIGGEFQNGVVVEVGNQSLGGQFDSIERSLETAPMQKIMEGGCHCGRVRFRVTANLDGVTQCNCSICAKKGCAISGPLPNRATSSSAGGS